MKTMNKLLMMALAMGMTFDGMYGMGSSRRELTDEDMRDIIRRNKQWVEYNRKKNLTEFTIDEITVFALNKKNAIRKVNNIKKQLEP